MYDINGFNSRKYQSNKIINSLKTFFCKKNMLKILLHKNLNNSLDAPPVSL